MPATTVTTSSSSSVSKVDSVESNGSNYRPITNFKPQERVNPFDKESKTGVSVASSKPSSSVVATTTPSSSGIYRNSITSESNGSATTTTARTTNGTARKLSESSYKASTESISSYSTSSSIIKDAEVTSASEVPAFSTYGKYSSKTSEPIVERTHGHTDSKGQMTRKLSDAEIIFGSDPSDVISSSHKDYSTSGGSGRRSFTRSGGSLSDADIIFGTSAASHTDRFGSTMNGRSDSTPNPPLAKSMSVASDSNGRTSNPGYRIYEGIQNAAFQDFDSPTRSTPPATKVSQSWNRYGDDSDLDLK